MNRPRRLASAGSGDEQAAGRSSALTIDHATHDMGQARCRRCNRPLHTALAIAAGLGPICAMAAIARVPLRPGAVVDADQLALPIEAVSADV